MTEKVETRRVQFSEFEIRSTVDDESDYMSFRGYAAVFNSPSQPLPFTETVMPGWSDATAGEMLALDWPNTPIPALLLPEMTVAGDPMMSTEDCFCTPTPVPASRAETFWSMHTLRSSQETALDARPPPPEFRLPKRWSPRESRSEPARASAEAVRL